MSTILRSLDLNLLLVFDAVYNQRSISKAAQVLSLSQPTVSNALARLRQRLGDPLFERGAGGMQPTPRARVLAEPIRAALGVLERGLRGTEVFDYANADREFVVAVEDYGETVVLPRFVDWLGKVSPHVRIRIRAEPAAQLRNELRDGSVDLALDYFALAGTGYRSLCVLTETLLSLVRRGHPAVRDRLSLDAYLGLRHVVLSQRSSAPPMIDLALAKRGRERRIAVTVPHFLSMPALVQNSDLVCTLPRRMAEHYAQRFGLRAHAVPLRMPKFPVYLIWHESVEGDAGHRWFRDQLVAFCARL